MTEQSLSLSAYLRVELTAFMAGFGSFLVEDAKINKQLRPYAYGFYHKTHFRELK